MGRKPIGARAMTEAERQRRWRARNCKMSALVRARLEVTRLREQVAALRAQLQAERRQRD
jgi:hypothetical protein